MKIKPFHIFEKVYGVNLLVLIGVPKCKVQQYIEKRFKVKWDYNEPSGAGAVYDFDEYPFHVLWVKDKLRKEDFLPKLSHEVFHHVLNVCQTKQVPTVSKENGIIADEAAAYLMEFYMREILKNMSRPTL